MKVRGAWVGLITMTLLAVVAVAVNYFHTFSDSSSLEAVVEKLPSKQAVCDLIVGICRIPPPYCCVGYTFQ